MSEDSSAYTATFKAGKGYEAPWLVIRADSSEVLHDRIMAAREAALFATIGSVAKDFESAYLVGNKLGGEPLSPPKEPAPKAGSKTKAKATEKSEPKADWPGEPAVTEQPKEEPEKPAEAKPAVAGAGRPRPAWKK